MARSNTLYAVYSRPRGSRPGVRWDRCAWFRPLPRKKAHAAYGSAIVQSRLTDNANATHEFHLCPVGACVHQLAQESA